ncbi:multiple C2 domain and transmembrane region protein 6-like [Wolffia australiana]
MKLVVEVLGATDLMPKDGHGSASPFVEVGFEGQRRRTRTVPQDLNPAWNEALVFDVQDASALRERTIDVVVRNDRTAGGGRRGFLGRVRVSGGAVASSEAAAVPCFFPLDKRGLFSNIRGDLALRLYTSSPKKKAHAEQKHPVEPVEKRPDEPPPRTSPGPKVFFSPRLCYLRVHVVEAQELPHAAGLLLVKAQLAGQLRRTRPAQAKSGAAVWDEALWFVAAEPYDEPLAISLEGKDEPLGQVLLPMDASMKRTDRRRPPPARWLGLAKPGAGKIHLQVSLEAGYHVLDEPLHLCSDLLPAARSLWKPSLGLLELGLIAAQDLPAARPFCVAKYGSKWVRTRPAVSATNPTWNDQHAWEVHDPCTVLTVGVFDQGQDQRPDQRLGKVRIRVSTLESGRVYTGAYPLLALGPSGARKTGEVQLAVRFTCTNWANMMCLYAEPLLPRLHYVQPIAVGLLDQLRHQAVRAVAERLARAEPPLRREVVECMLEADSHGFGLRRSKANFYRVTGLFAGLGAAARWFGRVCAWTNPGTTVLVHGLLLVLVWWPELIFPTLFLYLFLVGVSRFRIRPRNPTGMDPKLSQAEWAHPDELDEELDSFPSSRPPEVVRVRYDRLRCVAGRLQTVAGDLATQGERVQALLTWRDPRATAMALTLALALALFLYAVNLQALASVGVLYLLRHPRFRARTPSVVFNFYKRLPAKSDLLI